RANAGKSTALIEPWEPYSISHQFFNLTNNQILSSEETNLRLASSAIVYIPPISQSELFCPKPVT
ncbi:hypothetical protein, partial [Turicimonas muris]